MSGMQFILADTLDDTSTSSFHIFVCKQGRRSCVVEEGKGGGLSLFSITPDRLELIPASGRVISPHSGRAKAVIIVRNRACNATLMAKGVMPLFKHE